MRVHDEGATPDTEAGASVPQRRRPQRWAHQRRYRVSVREFLNLSGWHGGAYVIAEVEDTSRQPADEWGEWDLPRTCLRIADCVSECRFDFELDTLEAQENPLYKVETLISALQRFREGLIAEIELLNARIREQERAPEQVDRKEIQQ